MNPESGDRSRGRSALSLDPVTDDVKTAAARATIALGGITPNHHVIPGHDHADQTSVARR
jgi:hypothetical protein